MISGQHIATSDEVMGIELGADNYLTKPIDLSQLLSRIHALPRRLVTKQPSILCLDDNLVMHLDSREVYLSGELINLSRLEYNVLAYLARPSGLVRTKSDLLENVWSTPHVEEGSIAKCISLLRKKSFRRRAGTLYKDCLRCRIHD